ncbi:uncharacterized protein DUF4293 [Mucilaginibacter yixingensis]|uniref:Uncharacterized protein DUF4293 n=1 Tax=Mucilaginibacter yixingensis TaxID=1295612 RepID=A0A2T5JE54_9SPHI|nr:DUF4293 domain-containing protein [Mucilaginibacter yixingensis]PTR00043.1 uncharacterized protein DUF4293 [Mucilaginibacter yixingensis]
MLQRVQSIFLLFASIVLFAIFLFPLVHNVYIGGTPVTIKVTGIYQDVKGQLTLIKPFTALSIGAVAAALIPLGVIFMYKDRKKQIVMSYMAMLLIIVFSFWEAQTVNTTLAGVTVRTDNYGIGILLSTISLVLMLIAIRNIRKDEALVRSADRLR